MLNIFPDLLILGFFAPFILRITLGFTYLSFGYYKLFQKRAELISLFKTEPVGPSFIKQHLRTYAPLVIWIFGVVEILVGIFFIVGYLTQIVALISVVLVLKTLYYKKTHTLLTGKGEKTRFSQRESSSELSQGKRVQ